MTPEELKLYLKQKVVVLMRDGTELEGRLFDTPEAGLYRCEPDPEPDAGIHMSISDDLWAEEIESIRRAG